MLQCTRGSSCSPCLGNCIRTAAKPTPPSVQGPRGCCNSRTLAAARVLQLPQPVSCRTGGIIAAPQPTTARLPTGGGGVGGAGGAGLFSEWWRVWFCIPMHTSTGRSVCAQLQCTLAQGDKSLLLCASAQGARYRSLPLCTSALCGCKTRGAGGGGGSIGGWVWRPAPALFSTRRRDGVPDLGTTALGGRTGPPTPVHHNTRWRVRVPLPCAPQHKAEVKVPHPCEPRHKAEG